MSGPYWPFGYTPAEAARLARQSKPPLSAPPPKKP